MFTIVEPPVFLQQIDTQFFFHFWQQSHTLPFTYACQFPSISKRHLPGQLTFFDFPKVGSKIIDFCMQLAVVVFRVQLALRWGVHCWLSQDPCVFAFAAWIRCRRKRRDDEGGARKNPESIMLFALFPHFLSLPPLFAAPTISCCSRTFHLFFSHVLSPSRVHHALPSRKAEWRRNDEGTQPALLLLPIDFFSSHQQHNDGFPAFIKTRALHQLQPNSDRALLTSVDYNLCESIRLC